MNIRLPKYSKGMTVFALSDGTRGEIKEVVFDLGILPSLETKYRYKVVEPNGACTYDERGFDSIWWVE